MNEDLVEEINWEISILINSGFYSKDEILEIIEEQFIDENISITDIQNTISIKFDEKIDYQKNWEKETDFDRIKLCFDQLSRNNILAIHNAGYTINEGIHDSFEVFHHLKTKDLSPEGFCFYHFQSIENAIENDVLNITFGDFEDKEDKSLEIGKTIANILIDNGFSTKWNKDINVPIEIKPFYWKKRFDNEEYEMEGAFNSFLNNYK
jgi:uncharacterized protein DUF6891